MTLTLDQMTQELLPVLRDGGQPIPTDPDHPFFKPIVFSACHEALRGAGVGIDYEHALGGGTRLTAGGTRISAPTDYEALVRAAHAVLVGEKTDDYAKHLKQYQGGKIGEAPPHGL